MVNNPPSRDSGAARADRRNPGSPARPRGSRRKRRRGLLLCLLAVLIIAALAGVAGYSAFGKWKRGQALKEAQAFFKQGDFPHAESSARRALQLNPASVAAMRILADVSEHGSNVAEAISWRQAALQNDPSSTSDRIRLASDYLRGGDTLAAGRVLEGVEGDARKSAEFHVAAADLALRANRREEAENHFAELLKLFPDNKVYRLDMDLLRLESSSPAENGAARKELEQLTEDPELQIPALRALISDARRAGAKPEISSLQLSPRVRSFVIDDPSDSHRLLALVHALANSPKAEFQDRILVLGFLQETGDFGFDSYLTRLQMGTVLLSRGIGDLILWMNSHGLARRAVTWANSLPKNESVLPEVRFAVADSLIQLQDWKGLKARIANADWQRLECVRLAIDSAVCRRDGDGQKAQKELMQSIAGAGGQTAYLNQLAAFCERSHWESEAEEYLWAIVRGGNSGQVEALEHIKRLYSASNDSNGLWEVTKKLYEIAPDDPAAKDSFAFLSLLHLKDQPGNANGVHKMAEECYRTGYADPACAVTYAYSLYLDGRFTQGLRALNILTVEQRESPAVAGYYGLLLAATGNRGEAARYFAIAATNPHLLTEEKAVFAQAQMNGTVGQ